MGCDFRINYIKPSQEYAYYVSPLMDLITFLSHDNIRIKWLTDLQKTTF